RRKLRTKRVVAYVLTAESQRSAAGLYNRAGVGERQCAIGRGGGNNVVGSVLDRKQSIRRCGGGTGVDEEGTIESRSGDLTIEDQFIGSRCGRSEATGLTTWLNVIGGKRTIRDGCHTCIRVGCVK